jgi:hypothetical protein
MHPHAFLACTALFGWAYRSARAEICMGQIRVDYASCGEAKRNTYQRRMNDYGAMQSDLVPSIMWGHPSVVETFVGSPFTDWLNATHGYGKHDTYMLHWSLTHGDQASVRGGPASGYNYLKDRIVVAEAGCSIIEGYGETNEVSGRNQTSLSYVVWFAFAVCVGLSAFDMLN